MDLEKRIQELEKRVATLEGLIQEQLNVKFIPEDSNGKCYNLDFCNND